MRRIVSFLIVAVAFLGAVAQVEIATGETVRGSNARVEPQNMYLTCMVGETVTDTVYVYNISSSNIYPVCAFNSSPGYIWCDATFGNIPPGGVGKSVVTYTPEKAGTHTASMSMNIGGEYYSVSFRGVATEAEMTASPVISVTEDQDSKTIVVTGDGMLNVQVMRGEEYGGNYETVIDEAQVEGYYVFTLQRQYDDGYYVQVTATAQEDGKLPSEVVTQEFVMRPYYVMPLPEITFNEDVDGVTGVVTNIGPLFELWVEVNGETFLSYEGGYEDSHVFFVPRTYEEQQIHVDARNNGASHGDIWQGATADYTLAAMELPMAPVPEITYVVDFEQVEVYAISAEGEVHLMLDGEEVSNPYIIPCTDVDQVYEFSAYCEADGMQPSEWAYCTVEVPALPAPMEPTAAPSINCTFADLNYAIVTITASDDGSVIYYRVCFGESDGNYTDWIQYDDPICFSSPGRYLVEAYAIAPDRMESVHVMQEFVLTEPTPTMLYDFEENGMFYKITDEGKVSVCKKADEYISYSGEVVIPATVTHDGVTYMVTAIDSEAFSWCSGLTAVTIGPNVTAIGQLAFGYCSSLTSITLGDYVITLGDYAFMCCSGLKAVKLGSGLRKIGEWAFSECTSLESVTCKAATPPEVENPEDIGYYIDLSTMALSVYPAVLDSYKAAPFWMQFGTIVGEESVAPVPGDTNGDGVVNITDAITLINQLLNTL